VLQFCTHFDTSILLALFNPKDEGNVFFWNVRWLLKEFSTLCEDRIHTYKFCLQFCVNIIYIHTYKFCMKLFKTYQLQS
jgi:hypothetical protein